MTVEEARRLIETIRGDRLEALWVCALTVGLPLLSSAPHWLLERNYGGRMQPPPVVYLLVGLPGSGKSTCAHTLERDGVLRLSVDEQMITRHGRLGKDYPVEQHLDLLGPVVDGVRGQLIAAGKTGRSVVLDHGLGRRSERDEYKQLVTSLGATWRLLHFQVDRDELLRRLSARNKDAEHDVIDPEVLDWIAATSEEPHDEGEEISGPVTSTILYDC